MCGRRRYGLPAPLRAALWTFLRGAFSELRVRVQFQNLTKSQISKIKEVMGPLARNTVPKACKRFRSRIEDVFDFDGSFIE
jgi:hypothetical protein